MRYHIDKRSDYGDGMASISVRKLDDDTLARLRIRAAKHGISMEEEARRIIRRASSSIEISDVQNG